jgi:uncharacterized protein (DUF885 family)
MSLIFQLSDHAVDRIADVEPVNATFMGVAGRDHRWPDYSPAGHNAIRTVWADLLARAEAITTTTAPEDVAKRVLIAEATDAIGRHDAGDHFGDLNNIVSTFQNTKDVFDVMARSDKDDWTRIIVRLETIHLMLDGYRDTLDAGIAAGHAVARRQVQAAITEGRVTQGPQSPFNDLLDAFATTEIDDDGMRDRVATAIDHARHTYGSLTDWLESSYMPHATERDGCGADRYPFEARKHLGMTIDIDETYAWGWSEIDRITARMSEVADRIVPGASTHDVIETLVTDPDRSAHSVEDFIAVMQATQNKALEQLTDVHFDVPDPIRTIEVKVSPPGGALAPYYAGPSEDFSRPGTVWYPVDDRTVFPLWEEITTAFHEGFPGHHLQVGVQLALGDQLSRFHRVVVWQPGSGEGWALYAEQLMGELGFHDKPEYELGMLAAELMRACRVVIDIGLHCELTIPDGAPFRPGEAWSWDLAVQMLHELAHQPLEMSQSEATRYLGWPGQAIAYKVGQQVYLDLRAEMQRRPDFSLKAFHNNVLGVGSIGLDLLKELVLTA